MFCFCAAQLKFWFKTDLGHENSASYYRQGRQFLLTLITMVMHWSRSTSNFYALILSKFDRWAHAENLCSILNLVYFDSRSRQSFVSTCDVFNCLFPLDAQNEMQLLSGVFCYSWLVGFWLRNYYITCQSRKSDFGWHPFRFSPCLMRKGWKVWSDTGLPWYLSGAASRMVSLSNYCVWCLFFISNLMKSSAVYAAM